MAEAATEPSYITAARRQWELEKQASAEKKIRIVNGRIVTYTPDPPQYDLETTLAMVHAEEERLSTLAYTKLIAHAEPGQLLEGHGVFMGTWEPEGLSQTFNVFAAPQDLTGNDGKKKLYKYINAVGRIATLKNWHGFDGTTFATDKDLYAALENGSYNGGWFIPPRELLKNLYYLKDKGHLKGSFAMKTKTAHDSSFPLWYWSSSEEPREPGMHTVKIRNGIAHWWPKTSGRLSCRPVRLEPVP